MSKLGRVAGLLIVLTMLVSQEPPSHAADARQRRFTTPDEAMTALVGAIKNHDRKALIDMLGAEGRALVYSGDAVADRNAGDRFAAEYDAAHRIEAGADIFLMPSRYEPCGLNQLYSLKYGTVPVVHATGGLADTITNLSESTLAAGSANGFSFAQYTTAALAAALERACQTFQDHALWETLIRTGMRQDWSWSHSAREYSRLYQHTLARATQTVG